MRDKEKQKGKLRDTRRHEDLHAETERCVETVMQATHTERHRWKDTTGRDTGRESHTEIQICGFSTVHKIVHARASVTPALSELPELKPGMHCFKDRNFCHVPFTGNPLC